MTGLDPLQEIAGGREAGASPESGPVSSEVHRADSARLDPATLARAAAAEMESSPKAQLARLVDNPPDGAEWAHEIKFDGYRVLCLVRDVGGRRETRILTRNGNDWTGRFPRIAAAVAELSIREAVIDGEAVVLDSEGRSDFQALQKALGTPGGGEPHLFAFDLLHLNGWDLRRAALRDRKRLLSTVLESAPRAIRYSDHVRGGGRAFHGAACRMGLEGVVSKRLDSPYVAGRGSGWVKTKCLLRQEFVVAGWTDPGGSRAGFGSLVLGVHDQHGHLVYAGKVGTGFDRESLAGLANRMKDLKTPTAPLEGAPRSVRGPTTHWVEPVLVIEVEFTEWTEEGYLRHPSFKGLREDKEPEDVIREVAKPRDRSPTETMAEQPPPARKGDGDPIEIGGVVITSPSKVLYPDSGITKGEVARYWATVVEAALPGLRDRPLTLVRCPDGIGDDCFFQKHATDGMPDAIPRVAVPEKDGGDKPEPYMMIDGPRALLSLVQMGSVELHAWNARADRLDRPDRLVMDVDPGEGVEWREIVEGAVALRDVLDELGLESWPRGTGGKGLHVVVPLVRRRGWDDVSRFARAVSELLRDGAPDRFVSKSSKAARRGKIYVDYLRNARNATAVASFSPRARAGAPVAFPLSWEELFGLREVPRLSIREAGDIDWSRRDPWAGYGSVRQSITGPMLESVGVSA